MLTTRQRQVLHIIADEYIHSPVAVASENVSHRMPVHVSPATIRNEMAALEEEGYITRPHSSAGGIPSDKAYRAYVESLGDLPDPSTDVQRLIRHNVRQTQMDVEAWSRTAVHVLAGLVKAMAVATLPRAPQARWKHLEIVRLQEYLALLIMVLEESRLMQQLVPLSEPLDQDDLTRISRKMNANYTGLSSREARAKHVELTPFEDEMAGVALGLLDEEGPESIPGHYVDGLRHMFNYPELSEGPWPKHVANLLESEPLIKSFVDDMPDVGAVRISIGAENKTTLLLPFTVVFSTYGVPSGASGVVGIVGPTRLEYASAISNVRYLASVMSEMVEGVQGKVS